MDEEEPSFFRNRNSLQWNKQRKDEDEQFKDPGYAPTTSTSSNGDVLLEITSNLANKGKIAGRQIDPVTGLPYKKYGSRTHMNVDHPESGGSGGSGGSDGSDGSANSAGGSDKDGNGAGGSQGSHHGLNIDGPKEGQERDPNTGLTWEQLGIMREENKKKEEAMKKAQSGGTSGEEDSNVDPITGVRWPLLGKMAGSMSSDGDSDGKGGNGGDGYTGPFGTLTVGDRRVDAALARGLNPGGVARIGDAPPEKSEEIDPRLNILKNYPKYDEEDPDPDVPDFVPLKKFKPGTHGFNSNTKDEVGKGTRTGGTRSPGGDDDDDDDNGPKGGPPGGDGGGGPKGAGGSLFKDPFSSWCDLTKPFSNPFCPFPIIFFIFFNILIKILTPGIIGPVADVVSDQFCEGTEAQLELSDNILLELQQNMSRSTKNPLSENRPSKPLLLDMNPFAVGLEDDSDTPASDVHVSSGAFVDNVFLSVNPHQGAKEERALNESSVIHPFPHTFMRDKDAADEAAPKSPPMTAEEEREVNDTVQNILEEVLSRKSLSHSHQVELSAIPHKNFDKVNDKFAELDKRMTKALLEGSGADPDKVPDIVKVLERRNYVPSYDMSRVLSGTPSLRETYDDTLANALGSTRFLAMETRLGAGEGDFARPKPLDPKPPGTGRGDQLVPQLKKALYEVMVHPLTVATAEQLTQKLTKVTVPPVFDALVDGLKDFLVPALTHSLIHTVSNTVPLTVGTIVPEVIESVMPIHLILDMTSAVTHTMTRVLTHTLSHTLLYVLGRSPSMEYFCYYCFYFKRDCELCQQMGRSDDIYMGTYYAEHFGAYYSDYYSDKFATEIFRIMAFGGEGEGEGEGASL